MAKLTKKKAVSSPATNNKKRTVKAKKLQQPSWGFNIDFDPVTQVNHFRALETPRLPRALELYASPEVLNRLWTVIESRKAADPGVSHSARLLAKGTARVAQKLGKEAVECLIEALAGNRIRLIEESVDVLYPSSRHMGSCRHSPRGGVAGAAAAEESQLIDRRNGYSLEAAVGGRLSRSNFDLSSKQIHVNVMVRKTERTSTIPVEIPNTTSTTSHGGARWKRGSFCSS